MSWLLLWTFGFIAWFVSFNDTMIRLWYHGLRWVISYISLLWSFFLLSTGSHCLIYILPYYLRISHISKTIFARASFFCKYSTFIMYFSHLKFVSILTCFSEEKSFKPLWQHLYEKLQLSTFVCTFSWKENECYTIPKCLLQGFMYNNNSLIQIEDLEDWKLFLYLYNHN